MAFSDYRRPLFLQGSLSTATFWDGVPVPVTYPAETILTEDGVPIFSEWAQVLLTEAFVG